jgi:hypothetical protein
MKNPRNLKKIDILEKMNMEIIPLTIQVKHLLF